MKQMMLATIKGFEVHGRATHKAAFLARMEILVPWPAFCALMRTALPEASRSGKYLLRTTARFRVEL